MKKRSLLAETSDTCWKGLYTTGGAAALAAGVLFRRNLGVEIALFSPQKQPTTVADWFALLQANRLLGLTYLSIFDVVNYVLVGLMFLALYILLRRERPSSMTAAAALGFLGIAVYLASNTAFSLLALSDQYASAAGEAEKTLLLAAGQALLAVNRFSSAGAHPGSGGYLSLLFVAAASLITAIVMLRSRVFNQVTAWVGILASTLDLAYCFAFAFVPAVNGQVLAVSFIPAAGLFWMIWHILTGIQLFQLGRSDRPALAARAQ